MESKVWHPKEVSRSQQTIFIFGMGRTFHSDSRPKPGRANEHSNFLFVYFNFAYNFLVAPFKLREVDRGRYEIQEWLPQKILCAVVSALALARHGVRLRYFLAQIKANGNPTPFFYLFYSISSLIFNVMLVKGFWMKKENYLDLINCFQNGGNRFLSFNPLKMESQILIRLFVTVCNLVYFSGFLRPGFLPNGEGWSLSHWHQMQLVGARKILLLDGLSGTRTGVNETSWTRSEMVLAGVNALSGVIMPMFDWFGEHLILAHVITLWAATSGFTSSLRNMRGVGIGLEEILGQFEALKELSTLIDGAIGDCLMFYVGHTLFYYAWCLDELILTEAALEWTSLIVSYAAYLSILIFSAEIPRKMRSFKTWLFEEDRWRQLDLSRLAVIMEELADQRVGISANGVFTLNYGFVGTIASVLITYFIIQLQANSKG